MQSTTFPISGLVLLSPPRFSDARGFFSEVYNKRTFEPQIGDVQFVQDNHSASIPAGTIRGLHFQVAPAAQGKLVRVVRGEIFDIAVDIRRSSRTYGKHVSVILSAKNWYQFWIPPGFAHGFCTTEPDTEVVYKVTDYYNKSAERGIIWNDPELAIEWPVMPEAKTLSDQDLAHPRFSLQSQYFE